MKLESQDRAERPELYSLRDEIAQQGMPVIAANVVAREIYRTAQIVDLVVLRELGKLKDDAEAQRAEIANLQQRLAKLEAGTPPHLAKVEKR